jgi:hypothetical protein
VKSSIQGFPLLRASSALCARGTPAHDGGAGSVCAGDQRRRAPRRGEPRDEPGRAGHAHGRAVGEGRRAPRASHLPALQPGRCARAGTCGLCALRATLGPDVSGSASPRAPRLPQSPERPLTPRAPGRFSSTARTARMRSRGPGPRGARFPRRAGGDTCISAAASRLAPRTTS